MGFVSAVLAALPGLAHAQAPDLYYERAVMSAADTRCALFTPELSGALHAATAQARNAALRAGASPETLDVVARRARDRGAAIDCSSPALAAAAAQVRNAFAGFVRVQSLDYPGEIAGWRAERSLPGAIHWRLAQETRFGADRMTFGLAGRAAPGLLLAVARFADGARPYAAQLVMRDPARADQPYLYQLTGAGGATLPLSRRLPPREALRVYPAEARSPAGRDLLPKDARSGWAFRFPASATAALAALDPREAVAVEFLFEGDVVRRAYIEVGDFAAGEAFISLAAQ
jgi:hypothetical protein